MASKQKSQPPTIEASDIEDEEAYGPILIGKLEVKSLHFSHVLCTLYIKQ